MADTPWLKFYPQDWMGEPRLRACSLAARGLWMEMISLAHQATPYGHVLINGNVPDIATIARMVGAAESECESLVAELERHGVFSRTRKGVIYSRRMVKDAKRAAHARNIGSRGGNPSLLKTTENSLQVNPPDNPTDKPQRPEARGQKPEDSGDPSLRSGSQGSPRKPDNGLDLDLQLDEEDPVGAAFEKWWSLFPRYRRGSKGPARKKFMSIVRRRKATPDELLAGLHRYLRAGYGPSEYACGAERWLNDERWTIMDFPPPGDRPAKPSRPQINGPM